MATVQATGFVFMKLDYSSNADGHLNYCGPKQWRPELWSCRVADTDERIFVGMQTLSVDVPDDFNPTAKQVAALEREKQEALRLYQSTVAQINERLSKLLAITNEVSA